MPIRKFCQKQYQQFPCNSLYIARALLKDIQAGQLNLRAMSLVFTTFLSLVPLLAFSFSILQAFGVHDQMQPILEELLRPLGSQSTEITQKIIEFVRNMKVGVMGAFGLLVLIFTIISLTQKVEAAFNFTWRVETNRNFMERFSHYISVIVVGPILMFSALGLSASFMSNGWIQELSTISPFGIVIATLTKNVPSLLIIAAFSFAYWFIPNTRVKPRSALIGGVIAGSLWQLAGWAFASYVAASSGQAQIYSVFAGLFFFFIWMYVGWIILLIGSSIAYYIQQPEYARHYDEGHYLAAQDQERLGLTLMQAIAKRHYQQVTPYTLESLKQQFQIPIPLLERCLKVLIFHKILTTDNQQPSHYVPMRPMSDTRIEDILKAIRTGDQQQVQTAKGLFEQFPPMLEDRQKSLRELAQKD